MVEVNDTTEHDAIQNPEPNPPVSNPEPNPPASPVAERLPLVELPQQQESAPTTSPTNKCGICTIEYNSAADIENHWVQYSQKGCSWWVHCRCICIWYPTTTAGLKALNKWAKDKVFCPKHMSKVYN